MSHRVSIYLPVSMSLLLSVRTMHAQEQPSLVVCEDVRVSLGQTKQQVKNALSVCCHYENMQNKNKDGVVVTEYPNEILFRASRTGVSCTGDAMFDASEKLVFAERIEEFYKDSNAFDFAHALTEAISRLLPNPPPNAVAANKEETSRIATAQVQLDTYDSHQKNLFVTVGGHALMMMIVDDSERHPGVISIFWQIGNVQKWDQTAVPVKK